MSIIEEGGPYIMSRLGCTVRHAIDAKADCAGRNAAYKVFDRPEVLRKPLLFCCVLLLPILLC